MLNGRAACFPLFSQQISLRLHFLRAEHRNALAGKPLLYSIDDDARLERVLPAAPAESVAFHRRRHPAVHGQSFRAERLKPFLKIPFHPPLLGCWLPAWLDAPFPCAWMLPPCGHRNCFRTHLYAGIHVPLHGRSMQARKDTNPRHTSPRMEKGLTKNICNSIEETETH